MRRLLAIGLALALILLVLAACPPGLLSAQDCAGANGEANENGDDGYLTAEDVGRQDLSGV